jgi:hypothetical protein
MVVSHASTPARRRYGCGGGLAASRPCRRRVDVARGWGDPAAVRLRSRASVRCGATPRRRYRCGHRLDGRRPRGRHGFLRRIGSRIGKERHDRNGRRLLGDPDASGLDRRREGRRRCGGRRDRHGRPERRRGGRAAVRPPRRSPQHRRAGVRRSAVAAAGSRHGAGPARAVRAGTVRTACSRSCRRTDPRGRGATPGGGSCRRARCRVRAGDGRAHSLRGPGRNCGGSGAGKRRIRPGRSRRRVRVRPCTSGRARCGSARDASASHHLPSCNRTACRSEPCCYEACRSEPCRAASAGCGGAQPCRRPPLVARPGRARIHPRSGRVRVDARCGEARRKSDACLTRDAGLTHGASSNVRAPSAAGAAAGATGGSRTAGRRCATRPGAHSRRRALHADVPGRGRGSARRGRPPRGARCRSAAEARSYDCPQWRLNRRARRSWSRRRGRTRLATGTWAT